MYLFKFFYKDGLHVEGYEITKHEHGKFYYDGLNSTEQSISEEELDYIQLFNRGAYYTVADTEIEAYHKALWGVYEAYVKLYNTVDMFTEKFREGKIQK